MDCRLWGALLVDNEFHSTIIRSPTACNEGVGFDRHTAVVDFVDGSPLFAGQNFSFYAVWPDRVLGAKPGGSVLELLRLL
jgi:hypothetical protein